jgi:hypothetical protein
MTQRRGQACVIGRTSWALSCQKMLKRYKYNSVTGNKYTG